MTLRVGLLSTANINRLLLGGARAAEGVEVVAVASRERERAESYAAEHGLGRAHGSYDALLARPGGRRGLRAAAELAPRASGRSARSRPASTCCARSRYAPSASTPRRRSTRPSAPAACWRRRSCGAITRRRCGCASWSPDGAVGSLRLVRAAFSFDIFGMDRPDDVRLQAGLDGGGLMDVGCYCVSALRLLAGEPEPVAGAGSTAATASTCASRARWRSPAACSGASTAGSTWSRARSSSWSATPARSSWPTPGTGAAARIELRRPDGTETVAVAAAEPVRVRARGLRGGGPRRARAPVRARRRGRPGAHDRGALPGRGVGRATRRPED